MALRSLLIVVVLAWCTSLGLVSAVPSPGATPPSPPPGAQVVTATSDDCLACHGESVDGSRFAESIHGALGMSCTTCHTDLEGKELPHETPLAKVNCATCHEDSVRAFDKSIHAAAKRKDSDSPAATCVDCHSAHDIRPSSDTTSSTYALNLPATCSKCHGDAATIEKGHLAAGNIGSMFQDSIHGKAISRSGLLVAANCSSCHGAHDIVAKEDPASRVFRANIPATCGSCHEGIQAQFARGSHGGALEAGSTAGPVCTDCHSAHQIQRSDVGSWKLDTINECGTCHIDKIRTYRDTFHGQVTALGFQRVAKCSDCHGAHEVHPKTDARSMVSPERLLSTCQTCHADAGPGFAEYDPHADKDDRERNPELYYSSRFMHWLLIGVFGFFGVHALLWFPRSAIERRRRRKDNTHE